MSNKIIVNDYDDFRKLEGKEIVVSIGQVGGQISIEGVRCHDV